MACAGDFSSHANTSVVKVLASEVTECLGGTSPHSHLGILFSCVYISLQDTSIFVSGAIYSFLRVAPIRVKGRTASTTQSVTADGILRNHRSGGGAVIRGTTGGGCFKISSLEHNAPRSSAVTSSCAVAGKGFCNDSLCRMTANKARGYEKDEQTVFTIIYSSNPPIQKWLKRDMSGIYSA